MLMKPLTVACLLGAAVFAQPTLAQTAKGEFVTQQTTDQWRASKLIGVNVYSADNQKIGPIREVMMDHDGNAQTVVVGVGGFLGIGEKDVAVPFKSLQWVTEPRRIVETTPAAPAPATGVGSTSAPAPAGQAAAPAVKETSPAAKEAAQGYPDRAVLNMSKQDLQNAPSFRFASLSDGTATGVATTKTTPQE